MQIHPAVYNPLSPSMAFLHFGLELGVPFEELLQAAGILDDYYIETGREFVAARSDHPIPDDLTEEDMAKVKNFIDYILSKKK